jgi:hypothetical protein
MWFLARTEPGFVEPKPLAPGPSADVTVIELKLPPDTKNDPAP